MAGSELSFLKLDWTTRATDSRATMLARAYGAIFLSACNFCVIRGRREPGCWLLVRRYAPTATQNAHVHLQREYERSSPHTPRWSRADMPITSARCIFIVHGCSRPSRWSPPHTTCFFDASSDVLHTKRPPSTAGASFHSWSTLILLLSFLGRLCTFSLHKFFTLGR